MFVETSEGQNFHSAQTVSDIGSTNDLKVGFEPGSELPSHPLRNPAFCMAGLSIPGSV